MIIILKNIYKRIAKNRGFMVTPFILLPALVVIVFALSQVIVGNPSVAVVGKILPQKIDGVDIVQVDTPPKMSELFEGKYVATVDFTDGEPKITSVKGDAVTESIKLAINGQPPLTTAMPKRGIYTQFIGISSMFLFLFGVLLFDFYHKEKGGIRERILIANVALPAYIGAHVIAVFSMIFFPTMIALIIGNALFRGESLMQFWQLALVMAAFSFFVSAFGIMLASAFDSDEASLNMSLLFAIIGSLITGSFAPIKSNAFIAVFVRFFPQHYFLTFTSNIEAGLGMSFGGLTYTIIFSVIALCLAIFFTKKKIKLN